MKMSVLMILGTAVTVAVIIGIILILLLNK